MVTDTIGTCHLNCRDGKRKRGKPVRSYTVVNSGVPRILEMGAGVYMQSQLCSVEKIFKAQTVEL